MIPLLAGLIMGILMRIDGEICEAREKRKLDEIRQRMGI